MISLCDPHPSNSRRWRLRIKSIATVKQKGPLENSCWGVLTPKVQHWKGGPGHPHPRMWQVPWGCRVDANVHRLAADSFSMNRHDLTVHMLKCFWWKKSGKPGKMNQKKKWYKYIIIIIIDLRISLYHFCVWCHASTMYQLANIPKLSEVTTGSEPFISPRNALSCPRLLSHRPRLKAKLYSFDLPSLAQKKMPTAKVASCWLHLIAMCLVLVHLEEIIRNQSINE